MSPELLLRIQAEFSCTLLWIISILPLISSSPNVQVFWEDSKVVNYDLYHLQDPQLFQFFEKSMYLTPSFVGPLEWLNPQDFFLVSTRFCFLAWIEWSLFSKSSRCHSVSFSRTDSVFFLYHLAIGRNLIRLHNYLQTTFPTQMYLVL